MYRGSTQFHTLLLVVGLLVPVLAGCGQRQVIETSEYAHLAEGEPQPIVISRTPHADRVAWEDSEQELSEADWALLEQLGPRPAWDRLGERNRRYEVREPRSREVGPAGRRHNNPQRAPARQAIPAADRTADPAELDGESRLMVADPDEPPATQPTTQPSPATQPSSVDDILSESDLPVTTVELPDGRYRMIWNLQSFGGTRVSASRDDGTTRREVNIEKPDLEQLVSVVERHVGDSGDVQALPSENTLIITCNGEKQASILDLLARLDVAPRQVEITAKIFEVSHDFDFQQGAQFMVDRLAANDAQQFQSTFSTRRFLDAVQTDTPYQGSVLHLMQAFEDAGISLEASFQLLAESGMIRVVSSPRMTVAAGQTGYLLAGQELPIQSSTIVGTSERITTTYKPVGVQLYVTPQAVGDSLIKLHTITVVSSVSGFAPMPAITGGHNARQALINPILDAREAETAVTIEDGHTLVISGLRMIRTTTRENKVPILGDLPLLGWLFKNHRSQQQMTDLYFFLTPTLL